MHAAVEVDECDGGVGCGFGFRVSEDAGEDGDYGEDEPHQGHGPEEKGTTTDAGGEDWSWVVLVVGHITAGIAIMGSRYGQKDRRIHWACGKGSEVKNYNYLQAKPTEHAKENIEEVAVMRVC